MVERLCGRGTSQQGTESSAINYTGQVLDALMYFMLWELALQCALQTYQSTGLSTVTLCHRCFSAVATEWIYTWRKSRFLPRARIQSSQRSCPLAFLYTMKYRGNKNNNGTSHPSVISIHFPSLYLYKQCQLISLVYNVITVKLQQEMCHRLIFPLQ